MKAPSRDQHERGQALVELALALPVLVLLITAIYDFGCAIRVNNQIANMGREVANLSSRYSYSPQVVMNTIANTAQPLNMQSNGMMYITVVQGSSGGQPQIQSQEGWQGSAVAGTMASKIGTATSTSPNPVAQNLGRLNLSPGQTATVVEVFYNYQSIFSTNATRLGRQFYSVAIF